MAHRLSCSAVPYIGGWLLNLWATRGVPREIERLGLFRRAKELSLCQLGRSLPFSDAFSNMSMLWAPCLGLGERGTAPALYSPASEATWKPQCAQKVTWIGNNDADSREFSGGPMVRLGTFPAEAWVQSLVRELRSHILSGVAKKKKKRCIFLSPGVP